MLAICDSFQERKVTEKKKKKRRRVFSVAFVNHTSLLNKTLSFPFCVVLCILSTICFGHYFVSYL